VGRTSGRTAFARSGSLRSCHPPDPRSSVNPDPRGTSRRHGGVYGLACPEEVDDGGTQRLDLRSCLHGGSSGLRSHRHPSPSSKRLRCLGQPGPGLCTCAGPRMPRKAPRIRCRRRPAAAVDEDPDAARTHQQPPTPARAGPGITGRRADGRPWPVHLRVSGRPRDGIVSSGDRGPGAVATQAGGACGLPLALIRATEARPSAGDVWGTFPRGNGRCANVACWPDGQRIPCQARR